MASKKLTVIIDGKEFVSKESTKASKGLKGLETTAKSATKALGGIAVVAGAVAGVATAIKHLTDVYGEQVIVDQKLNSALLATNNTLGLSKTQLTNYATEMSRMTGISDEAIIEAEALLVTFTKIGSEVFPQALDSAANMSTMFGQDLTQSVIQLGTALNDPIAGVGRLKRIGISFSEDQKKMIQGFVDQNDIMSAQTVIIDELNAEFGGVAQNAGQDWPAKINRLHNAFTDGKQILGEYSAEALSPLISKLTEFIEKTGDAKKAQKGFGDIWSDSGADDIGDYEQALIEADNRIKTVQQSIAELYDSKEANKNVFQQAKINREIENQEKNLRMAMADWESINRIVSSVKEVNEALSAENKKRADEANRILEIEKLIDTTIADLSDKKQQEIDQAQEQIDKLASYRSELQIAGDSTVEVQTALNLLIASRNLLMKEQADALKDETTETDKLIVKNRLIEDLISDATEAYNQQKEAVSEIAEIEDQITQAIISGNDEWLEKLIEVKKELYEIAEIPYPEGSDAGGTDDSGSKDSVNVGGELGSIIELFSSGGDIWIGLINIVLASLSQFEQFNEILNIVSTLIGSLSQTVLMPIFQMLQPFLAFVVSIVQIIGVFLFPYLNLIASLLAYLTPVLEAVILVVTAILTPFHALGGVIQYVAMWLSYFAEVLSVGVYNILHPTKQKADPVKPTQTLGQIVSSSVDALWSASASPFDDVSVQVGGYDTMDFGSSDTSLYGGDTTLNKVPDIKVYMTFNGNVVGEGGMEAVGEYCVESIQAYCGAGGNVEFIQGTT